MTASRSWLCLSFLVVAGCAVVGPRPAPITDLAIGPDAGAGPSGPVVEVARGSAAGTDWAVAAFIDDGGALCMVEVVSESASGSTCGPGPALEVIGRFATAPFVGDDGLLMHAVMDAAARTFRVETATGTIDSDVVSLEPIGVDLVGAALHLPRGQEAIAVIALDGAGAELERFEPGPMR